MDSVSVLGLWCLQYSKYQTIRTLYEVVLIEPNSISEIASPADRGMLMSGYQVVIQATALVGFWAAYAANAMIENAFDLQWQIPVAIQLIPGLVLLLGTLFIPESP